MYTLARHIAASTPTLAQLHHRIVPLSSIRRAC